MSNLKKLARRKARHSMHSNEDARVIQAASPEPVKPGRLAVIKAKAQAAVKLVKRIPYYYWLWEKACDGVDYFNTVVMPYVETIQ
ncbi:hypothetical protein [Pseudomonas sp. S36]|uniref:hypothetical protein n=1 Tax=Pseudomonas sp. S36 TaxID=2767447 RepID=UPI0019114603|nr:hypothetical protein [Pseudomonas sp. S36]MBK4989453.1 hypothetical protein [Pseudomonas sp. S36]